MAETYVARQESDLADAPLPLSSAADASAAALTAALEFSAQKMGLDCHGAVVERLRRSDATACGYCQYALAKEVGRRLGELDQDVRAVYLCDYDATPHDACFGRPASAPLLHLIVWVQRKTAALEALVEVLDRALAEAYADLVGMEGLTHLLDVQPVDDGEVNGRIGYGALLASPYQRPIDVWTRPA